MELLQLLRNERDEHTISDQTLRSFSSLYTSYHASMRQAHIDEERFIPLFHTLLRLVKQQFTHPHSFSAYHKRIEHPFNYYHFGVDFLRPLVDSTTSYLRGEEHVRLIEALLERGDNVILFANHQTEVDPLLISLILEEKHTSLASQMIFVAGDRVTTDPLAVPFSLGCNLLCIYSKRHISTPAERKTEKLQHNRKTMKLMQSLLQQGGQCIYMAPSGGRDRPDERGLVPVSPFDPQSIEMFRLMAKRAGVPTHFYPLSLKTFHLLPPPQSIEEQLGEIRVANRGAIRFAFGHEIEMQSFEGALRANRRTGRRMLAHHIWALVAHNYQLLSDHKDV